MQRFLFVLLVAISSFYLGWLANGHFSVTVASVTVAPQVAPAVSLAETDAVLTDNVTDNVTDSVTVMPSAKQTSNEDTVEPYPQYFRRLLERQQFEQALLVFDRVMDADEALGRVLHADLMAYLQQAMTQGRNEALMALVDLYLGRYYDDVDVLLVLAEFQRRQGYPDEAARVLQLAFTYAYLPAGQDKVSAALLTLVNKTDALLSRQQRWFELLGFYQLLRSIDLSQPKFLLQQAIVYLQLRDTDSARALLLPLTENPRWAGSAQELLAAIDRQTDSAPDPIAAVNAIPLLRRGNHYLIKVRLNEVSDATLMIDTGASVTSLSQSSFSRLSQYSEFDSVGSRLFNTANGIARGDVYRTDALSLGDHLLRDVNVAVLDFNQGSDIDGLLGMNVLQYFRFEIDQDKQLLLLQPR